MKPRQPGSGERLPGGVTIEEIAAALGQLTTARVGYQVQIDRREDLFSGNGLADFSRNVSSGAFVVKNRQVDQLDIGPDTFRKLTGTEQQETGKVWRWVHHCPYGQDNLWLQVFAAMPRWASLAEDGAEVIDDQLVHRYMFFVRPERDRSDLAMEELRAHLRCHGTDLVVLHAWLADDATVRKIRLRYKFAASTRVPGLRVAGVQTLDFADFGIVADIVAPRPDQITGRPRGRRTPRRASQPASS